MCQALSEMKPPPEERKTFVIQPTEAELEKELPSGNRHVFGLDNYGAGPVWTKQVFSRASSVSSAISKEVK